MNSPKVCTSSSSIIVLRWKHRTTAPDSPGCFGSNFHCQFCLKTCQILLCMLLQQLFFQFLGGAIGRVQIRVCLYKSLSFADACRLERSDKPAASVKLVILPFSCSLFIVGRVCKDRVDVPSAVRRILIGRSEHGSVHKRCCLAPFWPVFVVHVSSSGGEQWAVCIIIRAIEE